MSSVSLKKPIRLIASDLDGTLLNSEGVLPEKNREALAAAIQRGVTVTLCTGRMFRSTQRFAEQIGIEAPLVCYNGAMLRGMDGTMLFHDTLDLGTAHRLLAFFRENGLYVQSYIDDELYIRDMRDEEFQAYLRHFGITGTPVGDALYHPATAPTKLLAMTTGAAQSQEVIGTLQKTFGNAVYVTSSNVDFVEIMPPDVDKGRGLSQLSRLLQVEMDEILTLGDGENDIAMFRAAGTGVAMAGGRASLKAIATDIAPTNDAGGVAWAVEKYVLNL